MPRLPAALAAFLAFLLLGATPVRAQDTTDVAMYVQMPDSVVVTATRQKASARLTGRRVSVWTRQAIQELPVTSFDELLRTVGGVEVRSRSGFGVQSDFTLRGSTFNGVLVLLDGARLNDPMTGHFLMDFPVPLSEIARIEVLRGPAAALYGPDALGGVIQIFTDTGLREAPMANTGLDGSASGQYGRYDLYTADGVARYLGARTAISAAATAQGSDGEPITAGGDVRSDFERTAATAALAQGIGSATLFTRVGIDDRSFSAFHFYTPFASDTAREATSTVWAQAQLKSDDAGATTWRAQVAAKQHEDEYVYNPQTPANRHTSRLLTSQAAITHRLSARLSVSGGVSAQARGIDSNNLGEHSDASGGGYVSAQWQPVDRLTLNASGRVDADPVYGVEATPQLYAAFNTDHLTLRGGVGRAVRAPNYIERYYNTTLASPRGRNLGNPDLDAERAWSGELGFDLYSGTGLSLHVTGFRRVTRDLIDYAKLTPADTVFLARNLLRVSTNGLEVDARMNRSLGFGDLRLSASYVGLDADLGTVDSGVEYKYALANARHLVQGAAALQVGRATVGLQGLWKERLRDSPYATDQYGVVHGRLAYQLRLGGQRAMLSAEIRNLFDREYADVFDALMPGRWWLLGASVRL